jgi:hypothetical protein
LAWSTTAKPVRHLTFFNAYCAKRIARLFGLKPPAVGSILPRYCCRTWTYSRSSGEDLLRSAFLYRADRLPGKSQQLESMNSPVEQNDARCIPESFCTLFVEGRREYSAVHICHGLMTGAGDWHKEPTSTAASRSADGMAPSRAASVNRFRRAEPALIASCRWLTGRWVGVLTENPHASPLTARQRPIVDEPLTNSDRARSARQSPG